MAVQSSDDVPAASCRLKVRRHPLFDQPGDVTILVTLEKELANELPNLFHPLHPDPEDIGYLEDGRPVIPIANELIGGRSATMSSLSDAAQEQRLIVAARCHGANLLAEEPLD